MIIVKDDELNLAGFRPAKFTVREDEGLYSSLSNINRFSNYVPGTVSVCDDIKRVRVSDIGNDSDRVRVLISRKTLNLKKEDKCSPESRGYILKNRRWVEDKVIVVPVRQQLCSRWGGLLESDVLMKKRNGRQFVRLYYTFGPIAAEIIRNREPLKRAVRECLLNPLSKSSK